MTHPARYLPNKAQKPPRGSLLNRTHPMARGLLALWIFNEATGTKIFDSSGNSGHGAFSDPTVPWVISPYGLAVEFDGTDQDIDIGGKASVFNQADDQVTVVSIAMADTVPPVSESGIYFRRENNVQSPNWGNLCRLGIQDTGGGQLRGGCGIFNGTTWVNGYGLTDSMSLNTWFMLGMTYDGEYIQMFLNGLPSGGGVAQTGSMPDSNQLPIIGSYDSANNRWFGQIAYVGVYNRMLSDEEMLWLYREPYYMF